MRSLLVLILVILAVPAFAGNPKRSRSESPPGVDASNTHARGNIWLGFGLSASALSTPVDGDALLSTVRPSFHEELVAGFDTSGRFRRELRMTPEFSLGIGLTELLSLQVESTPWDGRKIGSSTARLTGTLPGNDNLRLFGAGAGGEFTFSTEEDIYNPESSAPVYRPMASIFVNMDWDLIRLGPTWPVKVYAGWGTLDQRRLAQLYRQSSFRTAIEYKGLRRSLWIKGEAAHYSPRRPAVVGALAPGNGWIWELGIGARWRPNDDWSFIADLYFDPVSPTGFLRRDFGKSPGLLVRVDVPLRYQESKTEAIRALHFLERERWVREAEADKSEREAQVVSHLKGIEEVEAVVKKDIRLGGVDDALFRDAMGTTNDSSRVEKRMRVREELRGIEELLK